MASTIWIALYILNNLKIIILNRPIWAVFFITIKMKYRQLTKEQFSELSNEFSKFLATQQIDVNEWTKIKTENPSMAEEELNIFSDVVWEDVLTKTKFLEHISDNDINLFKCNSKEIIRIYIKLNDQSRSFLKTDDFSWFLKNPLDDSIDYFKASKKYESDRNLELFKLIEMGSHISKGELFTTIFQLIV